MQGRRNPGSAFKPFGLVAELENGGSLRSFWDATSPLQLECPYVCSEDGNIWEVDNAEGAGSRLMSLYDATVASTNVVYAQLSLAVGPDKIVDVAHRMGIESDIPDVPSVVLGSGAVSPLEMASAYSSFATNGRWARPYLVSRIVDRRRRGDLRAGPRAHPGDRPRPRRRGSPAARGGTGQRHRLPMPTSGAPRRGRPARTWSTAMPGTSGSSPSTRLRCGSASPTSSVSWSTWWPTASATTGSSAARSPPRYGESSWRTCSRTSPRATSRPIHRAWMPSSRCPRQWCHRSSASTRQLGAGGAA